VKEIISLHGGSIAIQSQLGQGSRVSLSLPIIDETPTP
jgi:signal transduction histidine kinase